MKKTKRQLNAEFGKTLTKEFLLKEHKENEKSCLEIATEFGCSTNIIQSGLRRFGIKPNKIGKNGRALKSKKFKGI